MWTDKSVVLADNISTAFGNISGLEVGENNFLVALSALGANSVVVGQGTTATDTMFVLDISGSMSSTDLAAMVTATNDSIHTLLSANKDSRVGVVLYSSAATVLLPLDRYTPVVKGGDTATTTDDSVDYIELTSSQIRTARRVEVVTNQGGNNGRPGRPSTTENILEMLKNSAGQEVNTAVSLAGGTYIQGGLWKAWQEFEKVTSTTQRTPVMVLMSDGAPTFTSDDFNNVPNDYEIGSGNDSIDGDAFLTQLTAAYIKEKMAEKYSSTGYTATAYFYTLGLGVSSSGNEVSVAEAVLDTSKQRSGIETYWDSFLALKNAANKTMSVTVSDEGWFYGSTQEDVTVTYDATITENSREFVNKAFSADNASGLSTAFKQIVSEISLRSGYYTTRLDKDGKGQKADSIAFANVYEAKKTQVTFAGNKSFLGGRDLKAGEFSFVLKDAQGKVLETVTNDASGKFTFTTITYTEEGTYVYGLTEVAGTDSKVVYDATKYVLTVTVKDVKGELVATTQITADGKPAENCGFTNIYTPDGIQTTVTAEKLLVNNTQNAMGLDGFTFDLNCVETGKLVSVVTGTDGLAKFGLSFTSADVGKTYTYRLSEQKGNVEGMVYSTVVYEIKVAVTQNATTGELELAVTRDGKAIDGNAIFTNILNKVEPPVDEPPKTGDEAALGRWILMMSFSAVAMLAVLVIGRKRLIQG